MKNTRKFLIALALTAFAGVASAVPITGQINIGGGSQAITDVSGTTVIGIDFLSGNTITTVGSYTPSGTYAPLAGTTPSITMNDFLFSAVPTVTVWSISENGVNYSFDLENITSISDTSDLTGFKVRGTGILKVSNFDDTPGRWIYTQSGISFSSENVPEPAIALLLATGLIGFGFARKMRKSA